MSTQKDFFNRMLCHVLGLFFIALPLCDIGLCGKYVLHQSLWFTYRSLLFGLLAWQPLRSITTYFNCWIIYHGSVRYCLLLTMGFCHIESHGSSTSGIVLFTPFHICSPCLSSLVVDDVLFQMLAYVFFLHFPVPAYGAPDQLTVDKDPDAKIYPCCLWSSLYDSQTCVLL